MGSGGKSYVREEDAWNTAARVDSLLVAFAGVGAAAETPLVACYGVLVCFEAAVLVDAVGTERRGVRIDVAGIKQGLFVDAERKIGGRDDLDEVHVVVGWVVGHLRGVVERVEVVVGPW